jgi:ABC-type nitrate/sulfonate/bicarbonate transport system permease component
MTSQDLRTTALRAVLPLSLLALWEALVHFKFLNRLLFPPPSRLFQVALQMIRAGELPRHLLASLSRLGIGLAAGSVAGLLCGLLMGSSRTVRIALEPVVSAFYTLPKLALLPMLMVLLGVGEPAGIVVIAASCFTMLSIHSLDAVRNLNRAYVVVAVNHGAGRAAVLRRVYLPACAPEILTGLRLAAGRALVVTISVEMLASPDGLGSLIWISWQTLMTEKLYVALLAASATGLALHYAGRSLEAMLVPWKAAS